MLGEMALRPAPNAGLASGKIPSDDLLAGLSQTSRRGAQVSLSSTMRRKLAASIYRTPYQKMPQ
jgi:hypothetical protein